MQSTAPGIPWYKKSGVTIGLLFVALTVVFFHRNIFQAMPSIPYDLLYHYSPWRNDALFAQSAHNPELSDQALQFYPWNQLIIKELKNGGFPLWDPFAFCGSPLFANGQSGVLFPLNLLNVAFGQGFASVLLECLRLLIAAIFTWAFLRKIGLGSSASVFGAVAFAFSRNMIVWLGFPAANAAILLPALFWAAERLIERPTAGRAIVGALLIAVQFLAGQPQTSLVSFFGVSIYLLFRLCGRGRSWTSRFRLSGLYAGSWLLGICFAAIQILPLIEYIRESAAYVFRAQSNLKAYPWYELISFIVPDFFGTPYHGNYWGFANLLGTACYLGIIPLILALMALPRIFSHTALRSFWLLALISIGIIYRVPVIDSVLRLPLFNAIDTNKFLVLIVFSLAVCAALELDRIIRGEVPRFFIKGWIAFSAIFLFALCTKTALNEFTRTLNLQSYETSNFMIFLLVAILGLAVFNLFERGFFGKGAFCWILAMIAFADLYWFGHIYNAAASRQELPPIPAAISNLPKDVAQYRVLGTFDVLPPNTSILYGLADARGYDAMTPKRYFEFLSLSQPGYADCYRTLNLTDFAGKGSPVTTATLFMRDIRRRIETPGSGLADLLKKMFYWNTNLDSLIQSRALSLFSVKYVLAAPGIHELPGSRLRRIDNDGASVFVNPDALRRCFLRRDFEITDEATALRTTAKPDFDFNKRLLLSGVSDEKPLRPLLDARDAAARGQDRAEIVHQNSSSVEIAVNASGPAMVVLNDLFATGWEAYVDGEKTGIYQANFLFRAVALQHAGPHKILFQYRPRSFTLGASISLGAVIFLFAALGFCAVHRMRGSS